MRKKNKQLDKILDTAIVVREACERFSQSDEAGLFQFYSDPSLSGMCAIASLALREQLSTQGVDVKLIHGEFAYRGGHCWIEYKNYIVDITATQFNYGEIDPITGDSMDFWGVVEPVHLTDINDGCYTDPIAIVGNYEKYFKLWPDSQKPSAGVVERILDIVDDIYGSVENRG